MRVLSQTERLPFGGSTRRVSLYSTKERGASGDVVIYCSDGQSVETIAHRFYEAVRADWVWFVGVDCSTEFRNEEYLFGQDDFHFELHEAFFANDVVDWATNLIGVPHAKERSAVFGFSCGGAFATSIGIRHPDVFETVFAFSIAGSPVVDFDVGPASDLSNSSFFLRVGSRESKRMRGYTKRLRNWLRASQAQVDYDTFHGGHELTLWSTALNELILPAYQSNNKNAKGSEPK